MKKQKVSLFELILGCLFLLWFFIMTHKDTKKEKIMPSRVFAEQKEIRENRTYQYELDSTKTKNVGLWQ